MIGTQIGGGGGGGTSTTTAVVTAHAGGGQANAFQLTAYDNDVTVVASANDSVKVATATVGKTMKVRNDGASNLAIYPKTGDKFTGYAINAPYILSTGNVVTFVCFVTGEFTF